MAADGRRRIAVLATSAYASYSGCRQYRENLAEALATLEAEGLEAAAGRQAAALLQPPRLRAPHDRRRPRLARRAARGRPRGRPPRLHHALHPAPPPPTPRARSRSTATAAPTSREHLDVARLIADAVRERDRRRAALAARLPVPLRRPAHPLAGTRHLRPPGDAARRGRPGRRHGPHRLRLRPHGGPVRPRHRGHRQGRRARPARAPAPRPSAPTRASPRPCATSSLERAASRARAAPPSGAPSARSAPARPVPRRLLPGRPRRRQARGRRRRQPVRVRSPVTDPRQGATDDRPPAPRTARPRPGGRPAGRRAAARRPPGRPRRRRHQVQPHRRGDRDGHRRREADHRLPRRAPPARRLPRRGGRRPARAPAASAGSSTRSTEPSTTCTGCPLGPSPSPPNRTASGSRAWSRPRCAARPTTPSSAAAPSRASARCAAARRPRCPVPGRRRASPTSTSVRAHQAEVAQRLIPRFRDIRRGGSAAIDLCDVAAGRLDGVLRARPEPLGPGGRRPDRPRGRRAHRRPARHARLRRADGRRLPGALRPAPGAPGGARRLARLSRRPRPRA